MVPLGAVLGVSLEKRDASLEETVSTSVAAVVSLVPEGLMVLASLTYAVAALRMSRRGALAQQLNAIESLAAVDVICTDKTGTLTKPRCGLSKRCRRPEPNGRADPCARGLRGQLAGAQRDAGGTGGGVPGGGRRDRGRGAVLVWPPLERAHTRRPHVCLGAPELIPLGPLARRVAEEQRKGRRVLASPRRPGRSLATSTSRCRPSWNRSACWCSPSASAPTHARPWSSSAHRESS